MRDDRTYVDFLHDILDASEKAQTLPHVWRAGPRTTRLYA